ncbi:MAG: hypothetical protein ACFE9L_14990 [Candidatus Hodarchaeota archaeon]
MRRRLPRTYQTAMIKMAAEKKEVGGDIDFEQTGDTTMTVHQGRKNDITLHPDEESEVIFHTHPVDDDADAILQRTPSPHDVKILLEMTDDDNWAIATKHGISIYTDTSKSPKYSKEIEQQMWDDYNRLKKESYKKHLNVANHNKRSVKQTQWYTKEWLKVLRHKYGIRVKMYDPNDKITLNLREVKN